MRRRIVRHCWALLAVLGLIAIACGGGGGGGGNPPLAWDAGKWDGTLWQ